MTVERVRDQRGVGRQNRSAVLETLLLHGPQSRVEIASRLSLSAATVSRIVKTLLDSGLVRQIEDTQEFRPSGGVGRPPVLLHIASEGGWVLGVDLGLSFQTVALADLGNRVISKIDLRFDERDTPESVVDGVTNACRRLIDEFVEEPSRLLGGFVMMAGTVDPRNGSVLRARYLGWRDVPLGASLSRALGLPIKVESIMASFVLAETRFGRVVGRDNVLVAVCGVRLVTGLLLNRQVVYGRRFPAGMVGMTPTVGGEGSVTTLDQSASGLRVLQHIYGDSCDVSAMRIRDQADLLSAIIQRDQDGDPAVAPALAETGRALGRILAQLARFVAPESLVIAGPLAAAPSFLAATRDATISMMGEDNPIEVRGSSFLMPEGYTSVSCGLAICEYLFERPIDLAALGASEE